MVVLNKIYTRTGDRGDTALGNGSRVAKHSARVAAYGTSDELNATIGVARLNAEGEMDAALARIQNDLFDLGADLCTPDIDKDEQAEYPPLRMIEEQVKRLEAEIDVMNADLEPLRSFILPGGSALAAHLHICRTVSRPPPSAEKRVSNHLAPASNIFALATGLGMGSGTGSKGRIK